MLAGKHWGRLGRPQEQLSHAPETAGGRHQFMGSKHMRAIRGGREPGLSDSELVSLVLEGDKEAFDPLAHRYRLHAYRVGLAVCGDADLAEDVAQETFVAAYRYLKSYDQSRPFGPWLEKIAVRKALDAVGREPRWDPIAAAERQLERHYADYNGTLTADECTDILEVLENMPCLNRHERFLVFVKYVVGLNSKELELICRVPAPTIRKRLSRAVAKIARHMDGY